MARLIINPGASQVREFELKPGSNYLGRGFANDLKIEDPSVSTTHAQILIDGGVVTVKDLGSTNGTFVNRAPVTEVSLQHGQLLRLGGVEMLFESVPQTVSVVTQSAPPPAQNPAGIQQTGALKVSGPALVAVSPPTLTGGGLKISNSTPPAHVSTSTSSPPPLPPPAPLELPPLPPPLAPVAASAPTGLTAAQAAKKSVCRFHPKAPARWLCPKCNHFFCDLCVGAQKVAEGTGLFCRPCGVQCTSVGLEVHAEAAKPGDFYALLPGAFAFPFKNGGGMILFCATLFLGLLDFLAGRAKGGGIVLYMRGLLLQVIFLGYLFAYMQSIIQNTARGDESEASLPDVTNLVEDLFIPCLQLVATVALSFGAFIGVFIWSMTGGEQAATLAMKPAFVLGCLYFPMGFLAVAMFDTVTALNPMVIFPSILKVPLQYFITCFMLGLVFLVRWAGNALLPMIIPVIIVPDIISSFIGLYFLTVQCRILGLLYFTNKQQFGWFRR